MKHKFSSMGRVAIALVLALSLSLVMAVPVAADVTAEITVSPTTAAPIYVQSGGTVDVTFSGTVDTPGETVNVWIVITETDTGDFYDSDIFTVTASGTTFSGSKMATISMTAADTEHGDLTVKAKVTGQATWVEVTEADAVIIDNVAPTVAVTDPNGTEDWAGGDTQSITWTVSDVGDAAPTIKLEYSADSGSNWTTITTLEDTALLAYSWTVPSVDSTQCLVKATATDDAGNFASDESNAVFTIDSTLPAVAVTAPNGGEEWEEGSTQDITWTASDANLTSAGSIDIDYSTDGGATWSSVAVNEANTSPYSWNTLPTDVYSTQCKVKVTATDDAGNSGSDVSNAVFTIDDLTAPTAPTLTTPADSATLTAGNTYSITWTGGGDNIDTATTIKLEYSADAGSSWTEITTLADYTVVLPATSPSYSWVIPSIDSANCLVKITETDDAGNYASDVNGVVFTIAAATEVWVGPNGLDTYPGTEAMPFLTIKEGIATAGANGIVNVLPGTYDYVNDEDAPILVNQAGLTLQSTGTTAETIIDATAVASTEAIRIVASNVTVDGFTVKNKSSVKGIEVHGATNAIVKNNVITSPAHSYTDGISIELFSTGAVVSSNELDVYNQMIVTTGCSTCTLSENTFTGGIIVQTSTHATTGIDIIGNDIIGAEGVGINLQSQAGGISFDDISIQGNTISETTLWDANHAAISFEGTAASVTNLQITGNNITDNECAGIILANVTSWGAGNVINNNNISGNLGGGLTINIAGVIANAENNWWGDASGPAGVGPGLGDTITQTSGEVDYAPWLTAAYAEPTDPVEPVTTATITLTEGYNLISLSLIPQVPAIDTMTVSLTELEKIYRYDALAETPDWLVYNPPPTPFPSGSTLLTMDDDWGYWVKMEDAGTGGSFTFSGSELVAGPEDLPPSYDVVEGWNLIGFKSTTTSGIAAYLGGVNDTLDAIYGYQEGAFFIPTELEPGLGYWIAVTEPGTIYP